MLFEILSFRWLAWDNFFLKSLLISGSWVNSLPASFYHLFSRDKLTNGTMHVDGDKDSTSHMVTHLHREMTIWFQLSYQLQAWKTCRHTFVTFMPCIIVSFHLTISKLNSSAIYIYFLTSILFYNETLVLTCFWQPDSCLLWLLTDGSIPLIKMTGGRIFILNYR